MKSTLEGVSTRITSQCQINMILACVKTNFKYQLILLVLINKISFFKYAVLKYAVLKFAVDIVFRIICVSTYKSSAILFPYGSLSSCKYENGFMIGTDL